MNWKKGMKWAFAVFAVLVLMSVFVGAVSAEADDEIGTVDITVTPSDKIYVGDTVTVTASAVNATTYDISVTPTPKENNGATFIFETAGTYTITVIAKNGNDKKTKTNTKTISVNDLDSIAETIALTVTTPAIGVTVPNSANTETTGVKVTAVSWTPSDTQFALDKEYEVTVTLSPKTHYKFANDQKVTINGKEATLSSGESERTAKYTFSKLDAGEISHLSVSGLTKPVGGASPDSTATVSSPDSSTFASDIVSTTVTWKQGNTALSANDKFDYSKVYTAEIKFNFKLSATGKYKFSNTVNVDKPEGATSAAFSNDDGKITITYSETPAAVDTPINSISITMPSPTTDGTPADKTKVTESGAHYTVFSIEWFKENTNTALGSSAKFEGNVKYKAKIVLAANEKYVFKSSLTKSDVKINTKNADSVTLSNNDKTLTLEYTFPATTSVQSIESLSLTVDAPVLGEKPDTSVTTESSANYEVSSITWYKTSVKDENKLDTDKTFEAKTAYIAKIKLTAKDGYVFDNSMKKESAKVNTKAASEDPTVSTDKKTLTLQYKFAETADVKKPTLTANPEKPVISAGSSSVNVNFNYKIPYEFTSATLNYGDGSDVELGTTSDSGTLTHTYNSASTYSVKIRAETKDYGTIETELKLAITKEQFKASVSASPQSGEAPLKVLFTDTSTGTSGKVVQRSWDFGDGTTAASQNSVTHTFEKEGTYFVKLFISDGLNQDTATKTITVTKNGDKEPAKIDVDYEPFIIIGDVGVPSPFDLIAEFVRLIQAMLNFDNYTIFDEE